MRTPNPRDAQSGPSESQSIQVELPGSDSMSEKVRVFSLFVSSQFDESAMFSIGSSSLLLVAAIKAVCEEASAELEETALTCGSFQLHDDYVRSVTVSMC